MCVDSGRHTMNFVLLLSVVQLVWGEVTDFYHVGSVKTFQPPKALREDSFFGFSSTYDQYNKRLMISAPREDDIGAVYECDLSKLSKTSCSKVSVNITRKAPLYKHEYWFGATLKASPTYVIACTPRYATIPKHCSKAGTFGRCYLRKENDNHFGSPLHPKELALKVKEGDCINIEKSMDTLGWSLDVGEDSSIIMGGPGMFDKTGIAANSLPTATPVRFRKVKSSYNFGYSVAIGYFMSDSKLSYAVSSTYGTVGSGQVYIYEGASTTPFTLEKGVDVDEVGSMYGAVLCALKINPLSNESSLLVGAPTYAFKSYCNTGAVYAYGYYKGSLPKFQRKIIGQKCESLFGSAIISVGDLNNDKIDEIAIGAPFEGDGVVYLYSGAAVFSDIPDKNLTWLQRIKPTELSVKSFGYHLAALLDYDNNGCNELAISAPYSDRVMLYTCLAAVTIKWEINFPVVKNRTLTHTVDFKFQVCMEVHYPEKLENVTAELLTDVRMIHPFAKLKSPNNGDLYTFITKLQRKIPNYCRDIDFILPEDKDYSMQIEVRIETKLLNNPVNLSEVSGAHVVLSDKSKLYHSDAFWATECAGGHECITNLSLTITSDITEQPFITGSRDKVAFHVKVLNTGEVAYDPCLQFRITGGILLVTPMYCMNTKLDEIWICSSMKPIKTNGSWDMDIIMDLPDLTDQDKEISLNVKLFDRCSNTSSSQSYMFIENTTCSIPLRSSSKGVYIRGATDIGNIINMTEEELKFSKHFTQIYTITNNGPTNFKELNATVTLQKADFVTYADKPISINTDETTQSNGIRKTCRVDTSNKYQMTAICPIDGLFKNSLVRIMISMDTKPDTLTYEELEILKSVEVNSYVTILFEEEVQIKSFSITTKIQLRIAAVEIWIYIVAGLVGLLLLIILAVVLYKSGVLQRKNKKKLENHKENIKRQTIRLSTNSQSQIGNLKQIPEDENETNEVTQSPSHIIADPAPNEVNTQRMTQQNEKLD